VIPSPAAPGQEADPVAALRALCRDGAARAAAPSLRAALEAIGDHLDRPLQLAVAGAVSAGKSTLINALLRRPVAPADAGECTRLVTWYEHGERDGVVLVELADGTVLRRALDGGRVPAELGVPTDEVVRLRVQLADPALRTLTVIDTPGVNTVTAENEDATRRLLFGDAAAEHAQALLYVLRHVQRFDADTLTEFRDLSAACGMTAVNTAAVLTQIDRRSDADDPWPTARRLAATAEAGLGGRVLDVVPVIGLLAETARAARLDAADVAGLRELAALPPDELDDLLLDLDEFTGADGPVWGPVDVAVRRRLVALLHRYGLRVATERLRDRPDLGPGELQRALAAASGYGADVTPDGETVVWDLAAADAGPDLTRTLADVLDRFARHAGRLKAFAAVGRLRALARDGGGPGAAREDRALLAELADAVDEHRPVAAGLRGLRILAACAAVGRGQLQLDEAMTAELMRLARFDDPAAGLGLPVTATAADVVAAAAEASRRWRRVLQFAGPGVGAQRARDVLGALEDIAAAHSTAAPAPVAPAEAGRARGPQNGAAQNGAGRNGTADSGPEPADRAGVHDMTALLAGLVPAGAGPSGGGATGTAPRSAAGGAALGERERAVVAALRAPAPAAHAVVGLPADAPEEEVRAAAAALAASFRVLLHRPGADRRAVRDACQALEAIAAGAPHGTGGA
jgi:hypothetical protein